MSARVVSSTGHHSQELDIVIFDKINSISLLKYESSEFYPIESVYGVIQVKSRLNSRKTIYDGLNNLASFKKLKKSVTTTTKFGGCSIQTSSSRGFGVLFAYKSTLKRGTLISEIKEFMSKNLPTHWPNAVVVLDEGVIIPLDSDKNIGCFKTSDIDTLTEPNVFPLPNQSGNTLFNTYNLMLEMLKETKLGEVDHEKYNRLPLVAGEISYSYAYEMVGEVGRCDKHGSFLRQFSEQSLCKIMDVCSNVEPIDLLKVIDIAYEQEDDNENAYARQSTEVLIYNPENHTLQDLLTYKTKHGVTALSYDLIIIEDKYYLIPYAYSIYENFVPIECPRCEKHFHKRHN